MTAIATPAAAPQLPRPDALGLAVDDELADVTRALHEEFDSAVDPAEVEACVRGVAARFADAPVRSFVPLLVRRYVSDELRSRVTP